MASRGVGEWTFTHDCDGRGKNEAMCPRAKLPTRLAFAIAVRNEGRYQEGNLGRNIDQVAKLLTAPEAVGPFRALANVPSGGSKTIAAATRLVALAQSPNRKERRQQSRRELKEYRDVRGNHWTREPGETFGQFREWIEAEAVAAAWPRIA
jgi:hypothetical protein